MPGRSCKFFIVDASGESTRTSPTRRDQCRRSCDTGRVTPGENISEVSKGLGWVRSLADFGVCIYVPYEYMCSKHSQTREGRRIDGEKTYRCICWRNTVEGAREREKQSGAGRGKLKRETEPTVVV